MAQVQHADFEEILIVEDFNDEFSIVPQKLELIVLAYENDRRKEVREQLNNGLILLPSSFLVFEQGNGAVQNYPDGLVFFFFLSTLLDIDVELAEDLLERDDCEVFRVV